MYIIRTTCLDDNAFLFPITGVAWDNQETIPTYLEEAGIVVADYAGYWEIAFTKMDKFVIEFTWLSAFGPDAGLWNVIFGNTGSALHIGQYHGSTDIIFNLNDNAAINGVYYTFPSAGIVGGASNVLKFEVDKSAPIGSKVKFFIDNVEKTAVIASEAGTGDWGTEIANIGFWHNQDTWEGWVRDFSIAVDDPTPPVPVKRKYGLQFYRSTFPVLS